MAVVARHGNALLLSPEKSAAARQGRNSRVSDRIQNIAQLDRLVHEPARLKILLILEGVAEADFLYLQREGEFTQGNLSSHLNKLEEAGLRRDRKEVQRETAADDLPPHARRQRSFVGLLRANAADPAAGRRFRIESRPLPQMRVSLKP